LHCLFAITLKISLDDTQWIQTAREKCIEAGDNFGWDWSKTDSGPAFSVNSPKVVNCSFIKSVIDSDEPNHSEALVLHLTLSTYAQEHPDFDPFILPNKDKFI
jgi:hypothetical protein